jgi:hypothetical protein
MKIISQEFGTFKTTMTIKNPKDTAIRPIFIRRFIYWFRDIQYHRNSILIIVSHKTLVGAHTKALDNTMRFI